MKKDNSTDVHQPATNRKGNGFLHLNPFDDIPPSPYKRKTMLYLDFVRHMGPFLFFITLTFPKGTSARMCCEYTSKFLRRYNERYFGPQYYDKEIFVEGVAFVENHWDEGLMHVHMLIRPFKKADKFTLSEHESIFEKAALKVKNTKEKTVFSRECIDMRPYVDQGVISYCFKQIEDKSLNRFKIIGKYGLTDTLDNF